MHLTEKQCRQIQENFAAHERTLDSISTEHVIMFGAAVVIHRVTDNAGIWHTFEIIDGCAKCEVRVSE